MAPKPPMVRANNKISDAKSWRGDVNVSFGDETITFAHRLLNESEMMELQKVLDMSVASEEQENAGQTEAQERLLELQQKEDLSDEEEDELQELSKEVAGQTDRIQKMLGDKGYKKLMGAGKRAIQPTDEDVDYTYDASPGEMKQLMGVEQLPQPLTKRVVRENLKSELENMVSDQPYPIKLNVGLQAFSETVSVLGNGLPE